MTGQIVARPRGPDPDLLIRALRLDRRRLGLNVVADVGHHDAYSAPLNILPQCARRLEGLPVLFVGVQCAIEQVMARRNAGEAGDGYLRGSADEPVPAQVAAWQREVHSPGIYDLEVDTSEQSADACAALILARLGEGRGRSEAFRTLALLDHAGGGDESPASDS